MSRGRWGDIIKSTGCVKRCVYGRLSCSAARGNQAPAVADSLGPSRGHILHRAGSHCPKENGRPLTASRPDSQKEWPKDGAVGNNLQPPFLSANPYNRATTIRPLICQFGENAYFISVVAAVLYGKVKNCATVALNGSAVGSFMDSWGDSFHSLHYGQGEPVVPGHRSRFAQISNLSYKNKTLPPFTARIRR